MTEREECIQARENFEDTETLAPEQSLSFEQHIRNCPDCTAWRNQTKSITSVAVEMPMFDVPEAVTQRIMSQVQTISEQRKWAGQSWILSVVTIAAFAWIFALDPLESVNGTVSWLIGLLALFGLKMVVETTVKSDAIQKQA